MKPQEGRHTIEALEAKISQETVDVVNGRQLHFDTNPPPASTADLSAARQAVDTDQSNTLNDKISGKLDGVTEYEICILTRPLRSLGYVKSIIPAPLYPPFSVHYGIAHWAFEVNGQVFEVRTEGWKEKGGKMKIRQESSIRPEYRAKNVDRYPIGVGIGVAPNVAVEALCKMRTTLLKESCRKYHFYKNNCQLIAAAVAIAGCRKPAAGWKTLVFRDDLRFFNRNNPGDLLKLLEELLPKQEYKQFFKEVESEYNQMKQRRRPSINSAMHKNITFVRKALTTAAKYTLIGAITPIIATILIIEKVIEIAGDIALKTAPGTGGQTLLSRSRCPETNPFDDLRRQERRQRNSQYLPSYSIVDWTGAGQEDNERWICAMYGKMYPPYY